MKTNAVTRRQKSSIEIGDRFGKLRIVRDEGFDGAGHRYWGAICDCRGENNQFPTRCREDHLRSGKKKSCGCQRVSLMWGNKHAKKNNVGETPEPTGSGQLVTYQLVSEGDTPGSASAPLREKEELRGIGYTSAQAPHGVCAHGRPVDDPQHGTASGCDICSSPRAARKAWNVVLHSQGLGVNRHDVARNKFVCSGQYDIEEIHAHVEGSEGSLISQIYTGAGQGSKRDKAGARHSPGLSYWDGKRRRRLDPIHNAGAGPDAFELTDTTGEHYDSSRRKNNDPHDDKDQFQESAIQKNDETKEV